MIDYIKIQLFANAESLVNNLIKAGYEINGNWDRISGDIKEYPLEATFKSLKIVFKSPKYIELSGSLHKHSQGGNNYGDFTFTDLLQIIISFYTSLGLNPFTSRIRHIEFGVNISPPFITTEFLQRILNYKGTNFNPMPKQQGVSLGVVCERTQIKIKIYCKKLHYNLPIEVMRIEMKVFKMQYLKSHGIKMLSDLLNPHTWQKLNKQLVEMFDELIITDDSIDLNELPELEKTLLTNWSNPKNFEKWVKKDRKKFEQERRKFRKIIQSRSKENQQQKVVDLIREKANQLLKIDDDTFTKFTNFINEFKNEQDFHFYHSINREIWNNDSPPLKRIPDFYQKEDNKNSIDSGDIEQKKEEGKIGKESIEKKVKEERQKIETPAPKINETSKTNVPANWNSIISELQTFFESIALPTVPLKLNPHTTIQDASKFISAHMATVINNKGKRTFEPYLERLIQLKHILTE